MSCRSGLGWVSESDGEELMGLPSLFNIVFETLFVHCWEFGAALWRGNESEFSKFQLWWRRVQVWS